MASLSPAVNQSNPYEKIRSGNRISRFQYPSDIGKYYIAFDFAEYGPQYNSGIADIVEFVTTPLTALQAQGGAAFDLASQIIPTLKLATGLSNLTGNGIRTTRATYGIQGVNATVALPIPANLADDQQLDYNAQNLKNVAAQAVSGVAQGAANMMGLNGRATQLGNDIAKVAESAATFVGVFSGITVNPFLAMMFNGPRFKTHQFGWRFSPKNEAETEELVRIINIFKAKALPTQTFGGGIFAYPDVVLMSIYPDRARERMYNFKPAVLTQVSVHHAPSGTPSFFSGSNAPVEIELKLQFSEISIWTKNDYPGYDV